MKITRFLFFIFFIAVFASCFSFVNAYVIEDLDLKTSGSIVVGPGKTELFFSPGDTYTLQILTTNVSGMTKIVDFRVEDMKSSNKPDQILEFLGNEKGPYSVRDYIKPEVNQLTLKNGQRVRMPVTISIPKNAEPGGLYGAIMISASNLETADNPQLDNAAGQIKIITRVASLVFITVKGDALTSGFLQDFRVAKSFYEQGPVKFQIVSANTGNVHLNPYGDIEIKDMFGRIVDAREVDPWFVMPRSERTREMAWNAKFLFGKYTATLTMNRGYKDIVDVKTVSFWIIPWKIIAIGLIILILIITFFVWILSHIQWKKDKPAAPPPAVPPTNTQTVPPPPPNLVK